MNPIGQANPSEDCLYLNVWTKGLQKGFNNLHLDEPNNKSSSKSSSSSSRNGERRDSKALKPIVFWIYGGSNVDGSTQAYVGLDNLARDEDICIFAPNYRLGVLGFLTSPALAEADSRGTSGNYAITDLLAALVWVHNNAKAFGCDPGSVTLYGQSSGGTNILALMASPSAQNLFHAAISLSPSLNITQDMAAAEKAHAPLIDNTSCSGLNGSALVQCLRSVPVKELMDAVPSSWSAGLAGLRPGTDPNGLTSLTGLLAVDGVTIAKPLRAALRQPVVDVPLLLSSMRDEEDLLPNVTVATWTRPELDKYFNATFARYPAGTVAAMHRLFGGATFTTVPQAYYDLGSATGINCGCISVGLDAAKGLQSPVYVAEVDLPPVNPVRMVFGALKSQYPFHAWDWVLAQQAWHFASVTGGGVVEPGARDLAGGALLRSAFMDLIRPPHTTKLLAQVDSGDSTGTGTGTSYVVNVLQESGYDTKEAVWKHSPDYRQDMCSTLLSLGFDDRFYWIN